MGGLGLQFVETTNKAFLLKVAWALVMDLQALWAKVVRAKYKMSSEDMETLPKCRNSSNLWIGLNEVRDVFQHSIIWLIGNGKRAQFWEDVCLPSGRRLIKATICNLDVSLVNCRVEQYISRDGNWDWQQLTGCLLALVLLEIASVPVPSMEKGKDMLL